MTILAIETATAVCAAAVVRDGRAIGQAKVESPHVHSEKLISLLDNALGAAGLEPSQVDGIAVSIGPGSFTGLRIGLSVAKGLAYACGKPVIPVLTLEALAMRAVHESLAAPGSLILPMIDSRRSEVYVAAFRRAAGALEDVIPSRAASINELVSLVPGHEPAVVMGDGADKFGEFLEQRNPSIRSRFLIPSRECRLCDAVAVGLLGEREFAAGRTADIASLEPLYVKDFHTLVRTRRLEVES